jgi:hypothetical protein
MDEQLNRDLRAVADWRVDLTWRLRRAELRFEFAPINELQELAEEHNQLDRDVASFKAVACGLGELMKGGHSG